MTRLQTLFAEMKSAVVLAGLMLFLAPGVANADPLQLFLLVQKESLPSMVRPEEKDPVQLPMLIPERIKKEPEQRLFLEVDEHGEVVMRQGRVSVILGYNSTEDAQKSQERVRDMQQSEAPLLSGFCIKLSLLF